MIKEEQNPVGPVLTAAESRRRVLHNVAEGRQDGLLEHP